MTALLECVVRFLFVAGPRRVLVVVTGRFQVHGHRQRVVLYSAAHSNVRTHGRFPRTTNWTLELVAAGFHSPGLATVQRNMHTHAR